MDETETIHYFDGRPTADMTIGGMQAAENLPRIIDLGYEFGYELANLYPGHAVVRIVFHRDDRAEARARAWWAMGYYRAHGNWRRPLPQVPLPPHLGPRIEPLEAAQAKFALASQRSKAGALRAAVMGAVLLGIICWALREHLGVVVVLLAVGVPLLVGAALSPYYTTARQRRAQRTVETYEWQQAVERGFIPPPAPGNGSQH